MEGENGVNGDRVWVWKVRLRGAWSGAQRMRAKAEVSQIPSGRQKGRPPNSPHTYIQIPGAGAEVLSLVVRNLGFLVGFMLLIS